MTVEQLEAMAKQMDESSQSEAILIGDFLLDLVESYDEEDLSEGCSTSLDEIIEWANWAKEKIRLIDEGKGGDD